MSIINCRLEKKAGKLKQITAIHKQYTSAYRYSPVSENSKKYTHIYIYIYMHAYGRLTRIAFF